MRVEYRSLTPFVHWWEMAGKSAWPDQFGRDAPRQLEIGFGNGEYLAREAKAHSDQDFVGLDLRWGSLKRALRAVHKEQVSNVRLMLADARVALRWLFPAHSLTRIYMLFPCPWRKKSTVKHRLMSRDFLHLVSRRLRPGGEMLMVTDYAPYLEWVLEQIPREGFQVRQESVPARRDTKYERKWESQGQSEFYELWLTQTAELPILEEDLASLKSHHVPHFDPATFEMPDLRGDITIEPKDFLFDPRREVAMLRFIVVEGDLQQNLWIRISRGDDHWRIYPSTGSGFLPTRGVQKVLDLVRDASMGEGP